MQLLNGNRPIMQLLDLGALKIPTYLWVALDGIVGVQVAFLSGTEASDVLKQNHPLVLNLLSTMKWKTIIISFLILAIFANFPASGISVTKALMARTIISADNFPASSLL